MPSIPSDPRVQKLLDEITAAFHSVTRLGGRSWTDAIALDLMGVPRIDFPITHREDDRSWLDVAQDAGWDPDRGIGGWPFLDAIGFKYYLAAAMYRAVQSGDEGNLAHRMDLPFEAKARHRFLDRWTLDERQHRVAMQVAAFMRTKAFEENDSTGFDEWEQVIQHWSEHVSQ